MVRGLPKKGTVRINFGPANGTVGTGDQDDQSDAGQLLLDLSLQNVEEHVVNLRNSILRRSGFEPEVAENLVRKCVKYIDQELVTLRTPSTSQPQQQTRSEPPFSSLPWTVRSHLSMWLRSKVVHAVGSNVPGTHNSATVLGSKMLNVEQFSLSRHVLDCMEDEAVLADVVGILCSTGDDDLIAALVATIQHHAEAFSAIGA